MNARADIIWRKTLITPFLVYTYLLIAAWSFSYLIYVWANGSRF